MKLPKQDINPLPRPGWFLFMRKAESGGGGGNGGGATVLRGSKLQARGARLMLRNVNVSSTAGAGAPVAACRKFVKSYPPPSGRARVASRPWEHTHTR